MTSGEPAKRSSPERNLLAAGVVMDVTICSSIGVVAGVGMLGGVMLLRDGPISEEVVTEGVKARTRENRCVLVASNGFILAAGRGIVSERVARNEHELVTRIPAAAARVGKHPRTLKFASGGDDTLFGKKLVWVDGDTNRIYDPVNEGAATNVSVLEEVSAADVRVVEIPLNQLVDLAHAINGCSNQDGGMIRLAIPRKFEDTTLVRVIGSDGIGLVQFKIAEDEEAYVNTFNDISAEARRMFDQLPASRRVMESTDAGGGGGGDEDGDLGTTYVAPGQETSKADREPWQAEYECTPVMNLDLPETLKKLLVTRAMETIGHLQAVAQAHPNKHFTTINGVGAGKAEKIGEAMRKVWGDLAKRYSAATAGA